MTGRRDACAAFLRRTPALQALLVQLSALALALGVSLFAARIAGLTPAIAHLVLLQALLAAVIARAARMPGWWCWIHLLFGPAAALVHAMRLPPWLFLAGFGLLVAFYWSIFRTRVPYYPSRRAAHLAMEELLQREYGCREQAFIDIGSGFGGLALHLARVRNASGGRICGIELAPLPWLVSRLRAVLAGSGVQFMRGDYAGLDLARFDVVFAYLSPAAMPALWQQARAQMRAGTLLVSHEFEVPGKPADQTLQPQDGPALHVWRM